MFVLACPTYRRYDTCVEMIKSAYLGTKVPDYTVILDNGGSFSEYIANVNATGFFREVEGVQIEVVTAPENLGVAKSWNTFLQSMQEGDMILIVNDDITFTANSIQSLYDAAVASDDVLMVASDTLGVNVFSCFIIKRDAVTRFGYFDEGFYPAYFEDNDYARRMFLDGYEALRVPCELGHIGSATLATYSPDEMNTHHEHFRRNQTYYIAKWGGMPMEEKYNVPFGEEVYKEEGV